MNGVRRDLNGRAFCDNPSRQYELMKLLYTSKEFIHVRTECLAATPKCWRTLQTRWDGGLKAQNFISKDSGFNRLYL